MENKNSTKIQRCNSLVMLSYRMPNLELNSSHCKSLSSSTLTLNKKDELTEKLPKLKESCKPAKTIKKKCCGTANGCGTPSISSNSDELSKLDDADFNEDDDFISDFNVGAILSTPALILPNFCFEKV